MPSIISINAVVVEWFSRKPNWYWYSKACLWRKLTTFKYVTKAIQKTYWSIVIYKNLFQPLMHFSPFEVIWKADELIHELYNTDSGCIKTLLHTLITLGLISSGSLALLIFSFSISSRTSDSKIGAKKNELLILFFRYCLKLVFWWPIFLSKLLPTLLKKSIKAPAIAWSLVTFFPSTCKEDILHLRFLLLLSIGPKCFCWITPVTQNLLIIRLFCMFNTCIKDFTIFHVFHGIRYCWFGYTLAI